ncbi:hypothetical protein LTR91_016593 [Friedmanniomyces endolithicus]|uniref:Peroxin 26 n=1 Tax=Friedmanniomyces endolithicus TaxID=329885 RepID=A0AAN6K7S5_9PEZI|nr:hypothetical protein LTS09_012615 [Friedmanniomyces endolithicus]KAK0337367.1 hypothetical protein LTR94_004859 [Friedmanniomyces endolithicus]KAK0788000.1 hypothetical protein LTR38_011445 [Friedmanniomyces endolithicus]KAK0811452.1 hypothetical protein LTR59_001906 [Friedmanniomyces endolithicus]KAK0812723.1 hypothetical protein LTR75_004856 [Friedmanniomyces endolithicus]
MAPTSTLTYQDTLDSQYLSSSLSSLSRSRSTNSLIVRTYKEATQLYLTKRFKEALEVLEPIITAQPADEDEHTNGDAGLVAAAPVAQSSKGTRTKVWVFYLSLLHAIVDLGPEEGKLVFGSGRWRELAAKARDGTVWEDVVQAGYGGEEGAVDADVVVNLATLLIGHMSGQKLNQQRLESWLASSDVGGHVSFGDGMVSPSVANGSSTPKALATRSKVLELYVLHVLPANGEWEYARQFVEMSETLDEERRQAFLHALEELKGEKDGTAAKERELAERRDREMEEQRREEEARKAEQQAEIRRAEEREKERAAVVKANTLPTPSANGSSTSNRPAVPTAAANGHHKPASTSRPPPKAQKSKPPQPVPAPPANLYRRASSALLNVQNMVLQASRNMGLGNGTYAAFRFLMFMLAFMMVVARRDVRVRVKRLMEEGWVKDIASTGIHVHDGNG